MALETLKGLKKIGEFDVVVMDELREKYPEKFNESGSMDYTWFEKEIRPTNFIYVRHDVNSLSFTLQNGPVKEAGVNGCQIDTVIQAAQYMLMALGSKLPSKETDKAVECLENAMMWLALRKKDRMDRGVEGTSQA